MEKFKNQLPYLSQNTQKYCIGLVSTNISAHHGPKERAAATTWANLGKAVMSVNKSVLNDCLQLPKGIIKAVQTLKSFQSLPGRSFSHCLEKKVISVNQNLETPFFQLAPFAYSSSVEISKILLFPLMLIDYICSFSTILRHFEQTADSNPVLPYQTSPVYLMGKK